MTNIKDEWEVSSDEDHILIIDGLAYVYRGVIGNLDGEHAITYNFFRNLRATIENFSPTKCFFIWEGHPKSRYELLPEYKANRIVKTAEQQQRKDKVTKSANEIRRLLSYLPIAQFKHPDYEADDVIAALAENLKDEKCTIISGDSDLVQLLQKGYSKLSLYNYNVKNYITPPDYNYVVWKCLAGDKRSDNIKGLVGPKTAEKLVRDPEKFKDFLSKEENRANFNLNKELIELRPIDNAGIEFKYPEVSFDSLKEEFALKEFKSIINDDSWNKYTRTFKTLIKNL